MIKIVSHRMFWDLFNEFSTAVKDKKYKSLEYKMWKSIQRDLISMNPQNDVILESGKEFMKIQTEDMVHQISISESFGSYLYDVLFASYNPAIILNNKEYEGKDKEFNNIIKEDNKMKFNFDFGPVDHNIRMSPYGMAIKNAEGTYVSYNAADKQIVDVDVFNFSGANFMFKMPVALNAVQPGDIVVHQRKPMFVTNIDGNILGVIDIYSGEAKGVVPTTNMFGFNFVTKVVSFLDMGTPSKENPFGNMWPLLMMNNGDMDNKQMLMMMIMMSQSKDAPTTMFQNPMFLLALMQDSDMGDMLPMMVAMSMANGGNFLMPQTQAHTCNGNCGHCHE